MGKPLPSEREPLRARDRYAIFTANPLTRLQTMAQSQSQQGLSQFMSSLLADDSRYEGLDLVVAAIADGVRNVNNKVQAAAIADVLGTTGEVNVQGEIVQILDQASSDTFVDALLDCGRVAAVGSEEITEGTVIGDSPLHNYFVLMDPLDGSSNIDVAVSIGSIFGIWSRPPYISVTEESLLQPGNKQVAAVYAVYGSSTVLVVAVEGKVNGFTLNIATGEFELTHKDLRIPEKCEYYSAPEHNYKNWSTAMQEVVDGLRDTHSLRYVGSLVADFHRNLLKGGIFLYPGDSKSPQGKLRLMYEANPLGYVAEQAGVNVSDGSQRILDILPTKLHQRVPLIVGNASTVVDTIEKLQK